MSEATFEQICDSTGKTDEEIAEKACIKVETLEHYKKTNKPSLSAKNAVAALLIDKNENKEVPAEFLPTTLSVDREPIPRDYTDNDEWHFMHIYDFQPGGTERVNADVQMLKAGDEIGRYGEVHRFSPTYVVMRCPISHYWAREKRDQQKAADAWPKDLALEKGQTGTTTQTKRETRFIEGPAGVPTGEPIAI